MNRLNKQIVVSIFVSFIGFYFVFYIVVCVFYMLQMIYSSVSCHLMK